jgi:hypothetical protein
MLVAGLSLVACATSESARMSSGQAQTTDQSRRAELYPQVTNFLNEAAALEPIVLTPRLEYPTLGTLPGWRDKVCPKVTGLPREDGEFVLARVVEIARAAGVRMDGPHCSPNLYVFVTPQPTQLLTGMESSYEMFGPRGIPHLLDQFIATPRPVKVWYNIYGAGPSVSFKFAFTRVLVVVDQTRLQGVSRSQLADYIAMVGLAEIKPDAHLTEAPTILRLFAGAPQAAPAGLTDLDQAFLKSLYLNARSIPWGREFGVSDQLTLRMVSTIAP